MRHSSIHTVRRRRGIPSLPDGCLSVVSVTPQLRGRVTPLVRTLHKDLPINFCLHTRVSSALFRAIWEVPKYPIQQACCLHVSRTLHSLFLEHSQSTRQILSVLGQAQGFGKPCCIFNSHSSTLRHVRQHSMGSITEDQKLLRRRNPCWKLRPAHQRPFQSRVDKADHLHQSAFISGLFIFDTERVSSPWIPSFELRTHVFQNPVRLQCVSTSRVWVR